MNKAIKFLPLFLLPMQLALANLPAECIQPDALAAAAASGQIRDWYDEDINSCKDVALNQWYVGSEEDRRPLKLLKNSSVKWEGIGGNASAYGNQAVTCIYLADRGESYYPPYAVVMLTKITKPLDCEDESNKKMSFKRFGH